METISLFKHEEPNRTLAPGEVLFSQGDEAETIFVVKSGALEVVVGDEVVETVADGALLGEMALVGDLPRSATVRAVSDAQLIEMNEKDFLWRVDNTPMFALQVLRISMGRLRRMNERLDGLT